MVKQKGQAEATSAGFKAAASSARSMFTRFPIRSSIHIRPPPAPQQNPCSRDRAISTRRIPGMASSTCRGPS